jgi:hypothetical protein
VSDLRKLYLFDNGLYTIFIRLVKKISLAWVFHPLLRRFEQKIGKNEDGDRKSG